MVRFAMGAWVIRMIKIWVIGALLADPVVVITGEMTFRERCGVLGGSVCECDDRCDCGPDYCDCSSNCFDYDGLEDFGHCPMCMGLLDRMGMGCVRIFMIWVAVGRVLCLSEMPV